MSWYSWLQNHLHRLFGAAGPARAQEDSNATAEFSTPSSLTLVSGALKLRVGVISETGHYREQNEDNFYVPGRHSVRFDLPSASHRSGDIEASSFDSSNVLFIVADGMGGQQAGEQASKMAVELIPKALARRMRPNDAEPRAIQGVIRDAVAEANQEILGCSGAVAEFSNMGTTVVLALFHNNRAFIAGIGDSRAYRLRGGVLEQMTKDHSLADALGEAGTISKEEIPHHKFKNVLYLYLGSKDARTGPEDVRVLEVQAGDRFLLASDGLTGVVSDNELIRVLQTCDDPQRAARVLVDQALANDSKDNITSLVIHVLGEEHARA